MVDVTLVFGGNGKKTSIFRLQQEKKQNFGKTTIFFFNDVGTIPSYLLPIRDRQCNKIAIGDSDTTFSKL